MSTLTHRLAVDHASPMAPRWIRAGAALGFLWNLYGIYQFAASRGATRESLMAGMSAAQAELYLGLPTWMTLAFAVGVFGGLLGSVALGLRRRAAVPVFAVSLVAYVALFAGDAAYGLFAAMPAQLTVLSFVVLVAVALAAGAGVALRRGLLR